jgi:heme a synthase
VATPEMGLHGVVEFANRVVGIAVGLITLLMLIAVLRHRPRPRPAAALAIGTLALVVAQGFVGGLSVRQELAPEIVAVHFLVSMIIIAGVTVLVDVLRRPGARLEAPEQRGIAWLVAALPVVLTAVLVLGTLVTGSGPHAGDEGARRFGFDPAAMSQLHADAVLVFLALQIAALVAMWVTGASSAQRRAVLLLLGASVVQAAIGYAQYALGLPIPLVAAHVLGAALLTFAVTHLFVRVWRDGSA